MRSMAFGNRMNKRINDEEAPAPDYDYLPEPVVAQVLLSAFRLGGGGGGGGSSTLSLKAPLLSTLEKKTT